MKAVEKNNGAFSLKPRTAFQSSMIINFSAMTLINEYFMISFH